MSEELFYSGWFNTNEEDKTCGRCKSTNGFLNGNFFLAEMGRFADNGYLVAWSILEAGKQNTQFILHMLPDRVIIYSGLNSSVFTMRKDWSFVFKSY